MNPHFYRLRKETVRKDYAGRATERCERDSLRVVLPVRNSNETRNGGTGILLCRIIYFSDLQSKPRFVFWTPGETHGEHYCSDRIGTPRYFDGRRNGGPIWPQLCKL